MPSRIPPSLALLLGLGRLLSAHAQTPVLAGKDPAPRPFQTAYLRAGIGACYDVNKYYRCGRYSLEYAPMLSRKVGLATRVVGVRGAPSSGLETQVPHQNYQAGYFEQEVLYYPLGLGRRVRFAVGAGGFAGYYKKNGFEYIQATAGRVDGYKLASWQGGHAGWLGSLNLEVGLGASQRWLAGLKVTTQSGASGISRTDSYNLTWGRRF